MTKLAVLYATRGGMGDVGKLAIAHARAEGINVRALALSDESADTKAVSSMICSYDETDPKDIGADNIDVQDADIKAKAADALRASSVTKIDIMSAEAEEEIRKQIEGVDTVVACIGSRQESKVSRWNALGTRKVTQAMKSAKVSRLIFLSSMGIGDDFLPISFIKVFWGFLLRTALRSAFKDLCAAEELVFKSDVDYLVGRPTGLSPEEKESGSWKLVTKPKSGGLAMTVAKGDVAKFMVSEAVKPTFSRAAVSIGK